ncbi:MAG: hypothetical protein P9L92_09490 [Candidatus Electryonea clarkiae]|nr:hypothetical protein [Candidatus Electryonea clarkiae]MDP8288644.1 hypothetical protein [Candidatus Electryonea clarkiae]
MNHLARILYQVFIIVTIALTLVVNSGCSTIGYNIGRKIDIDNQERIEINPDSLWHLYNIGTLVEVITKEDRVYTGYVDKFLKRGFVIVIDRMAESNKPARKVSILDHYNNRFILNYEDISKITVILRGNRNKIYSRIGKVVDYSVLIFLSIIAANSG